MTKGRGGIEERGIKAVAIANHESWYYHPTIMKGIEGKEKKDSQRSQKKKSDALGCSALATTRGWQGQARREREAMPKGR
jgi:hypothetical protein